jgi:polar amino acid transport system substrate-binding protein
VLLLRPETRKRLLLTYCLQIMGDLLVALLVFSACALPSTSTNAKPTAKPTIITPSNLLVSGFLTVGSYTTYPPQEDINQTTNVAVGFDIDLINAIASRMHLKTKIISTDYQNIISNLRARNFDVVISAVSITPELQNKVDFVPYFNGGESLLVEKGNPLGIKSLKDLCGQKVAVRAATLEQKDLTMTSDSCQNDRKPSVQLIIVQNQADVIQLLLNKNVVATYQDSPVTDYFIKQHPDRFESGGPVIDANLEGIAIRKGDTAMFKGVQMAFEAVKADGTYCTLINKWGLVSGVLMQGNRRIC